METKQYLALEVQKGDFTFVFQIPNGSTWGSAIDASFDVLQKLNELSRQSVEAMKPKQDIESEVLEAQDAE